MPHVQWLVVKETDDDKTRSRKKKLQKSHKSKLRFQQLDQEVKHRQDSWQNFKKGKGAKKKVWQNIILHDHHGGATQPMQVFCKC